MTFEESIPIAKQLAENQLKKGFDVEAFLILSSLKQFPVTEDEVPESEVDDKIIAFNEEKDLYLIRTY